MTEQERPLPIGSVVPPASDAPEDDEDEKVAAMLWLPDPEAWHGWTTYRVKRKRPAVRRDGWRLGP